MQFLNNIYFILRLLIVVITIPFFIFENSYGRSLKEIKESGEIRIAIRNKPTVMVTNVDGNRSGLHYDIAVKFAESIGVAAKFKTVKFADYFRLNGSGDPVLFDQVDLYADNLTITKDRQSLMEFVPLYKILEVCIHSRRVKIETLEQLVNFSSSVAMGSSFEKIYSKIEKKLDQKLTVTKVNSTETQLQDIIAGQTHYTIYDSDQAFYYVKRYPGLTINIDLFRGIATPNHIGWAMSKKSRGLSEALNQYIESMLASGEFSLYWNRTYGVSYPDYVNLIEILDQKGSDYFKKSVGFIMNNEYEKAKEVFDLASQFSFTSANLDNYFDTLYLSWSLYEKKREEGNPFAILDDYFDLTPSQYFLNKLKKVDAELHNKYLEYLKGLRAQTPPEDKQSLIEIQKKIVLLDSGDSFEQSRLNQILGVEVAKKVAQETNIIVQPTVEEKLSGKLAASDDKTALGLLANYIDENPNSNFIKSVKDENPVLVDDYLYQLRTDRDDAIAIKDFNRALELQNKIVNLEPDSFEEKNTLKILRFQKQKFINSKREKTTPEQETNNVILLAQEEAIVVVPKKKILNQKVSTAPALGLVLDQKKVNDNKKSPESAKKADSVPIEILKKKTEKEISDYEGERFYTQAIKLFKNNELESALDLFRQSLALDFRPEENKRYISRIEKLIEDNKQRKLDADLDRFNKEFLNALQEYRNENYNKALSYIMICLNIFPDNRQAQRYYKIISDNINLTDEHSISRSSPYYLYFSRRVEVGERHIERKQYEEGKAVFEDLLTQFPNNDLAREKLIVCLYKLNPQVMQDYLDDLLADGNKLLKQGNKKEAREKFTFVKKIKPNQPGISKLLNETQREKIKPPPARKKALNVNLATAQAQALELYKNNRLAEALDLYKKILRDYPTDHSALINASRIENALNTLGSKKYQVTEYSNQRKTAEGLYLKGRFYFRIKDYEKALSFWQKAYQADPTYRKAMIDATRVERYIQRFGSN